jgi:hypothetical protein
MSVQRSSHVAAAPVVVVLLLLSLALLFAGQ